MAECSRFPRVNWAYLALGGALLALAGAEAWAQDGDRGEWATTFLLLAAIPFFGACWLVLRAPGRRSTTMIVLGVALALRLIALFSPPYLSTDLYRYIWDGRVQAAGINPYLYVPADPALAKLRDEEIYPKINRREYAHTIYPPLAQAVFFLTTRVSETTFWMKATMLLAELGAVAAVAKLLALTGLPLTRLLLYAWHPLPVWELAGAGHVDALMITGLWLALLLAWQGRQMAAGWALAAAFLAKFFPLALAPVLHRRGGWKMPVAFVAAVFAGYLPYYFTVGGSGSPWEKMRTILGFLGTYTQEEGLRDGSGYFLRQLFPFIPAPLYLGAGALALAGVALYSWLTPPRDSLSLFRRSLLMVATVIVFTSPHYAWYFCWGIPFLCFVPSRAFLWLSAAAPVLYFSWGHPDARSILWMNAFIYLPAAALAVLDFRKRSTL